MKELFTTPVIWFLVGLVFLLLELVLPGLIVIFFGVGAWLVAITLLVFPHMGLTAQLWVFAISSVIMLLLLRRALKNRFFKEEETGIGSLDDEFIGKTGIAVTKMETGKPGKISFKGTQWTAIPDCDIAKGEAVKVIDKESITLKVTSAT